MLEAEDYLFEVMKKRLEHLTRVIDNPMDPDVLRDYFSKRLNRSIIDYLLRENYFGSASTFIDETGLKVFIFSLTFFSRILLMLKCLKRLARLWIS